MKKFLSIVGAILVTTSCHAQDKSERPTPLTSTLIGVCENRAPALLVAIFTFENGKVLFVDGKNMQGFANVADIVRYAATAGTIQNYAQQCGDATT
jgi:hypothetical protein